MPNMPKHNAKDHPTSHAPATTTTTPPPASFPSFPLLPPERATRIITLACRSPELACKKDEEIKKRSPLALDIQATLNLACVSKEVGKVATSTLYQSVRIYKPSALVELHNALKASPGLAKMIRNLHVGAKDDLPVSKWPLEVEFSWDGEDVSLLLKTSLTDDTAGQSGNDYYIGSLWDVELNKTDCHKPDKNHAIRAAITSALEHIDLNPYRRNYGKSGQRIGAELWATRTFELQACLDLYLLEIHRLEEASKSNSTRPSRAKATSWLSFSTSSLKHFPTLAVTGHLSAASRAASDLKSSPELLVLSRAQLWEHLTRRGSTLDQFDHPILFARTGLKELYAPTINAYGQRLIGKYVAGPHSGVFADEDEENAMEASSGDANQREDPILREAAAIRTHGLAARHTIPGLISTTRDIIAMASNLDNLSLLGSLDRCIHWPAPAFATIRSLSLGPLFPVWTDSRIFTTCAKDMVALENLRVCGASIEAEEANQVAGVGGCFPKLKRFQWELVETYKPYAKSRFPPQNLIKKIRRLQSSPPGSSSRSSSSTTTTEPDLPSRLIEVRLPPETCTAIFSQLATDTPQAWKAGTQLDADGKGNFAPHRIRLTESDAAKCGEEQLQVGTRKLHADARKWFEDCCSSSSFHHKDGEWMPGASEGYSRAPRKKSKLYYEADETRVQSCATFESLGEDTDSEEEQEEFAACVKIRGKRD